MQVFKNYSITGLKRYTRCSIINLNINLNAKASFKTLYIYKHVYYVSLLYLLYYTNYKP